MTNSEYQLPSFTPALDAQFRAFYQAIHGTGAVSPVPFDSEAVPYLLSVQGDWAKHDMYFNAFTPLWQRCLANNNYEQASTIWPWALRPVYAAESTAGGLRFHKGAAYYFWGVSAILSGDMDRGFLLMHSALEEDVKTHKRLDPSTPSLRLVAIDGQHPEQLFRPWVVLLQSSLDERLKSFRARTGRNLGTDEFRAKFLSDTSTREAAFLFSYSLARIMRLRGAFPLQVGTFASQMFLNILFDLCLVVDAAIKHKAGPVAGWKFIDLATNLARSSGLGLSKADLRAVNQCFQADFERALGEASGDAMTIASRRLTGLDASIAVVYGLRNRGAHAPGSVPLVAASIDRLLEHTFDTLFLCVETLY